MNLILKSNINREDLRNYNDGFTIVELMIALSVLSVILIMSTVILIQIGGLYNKGVSNSNLQNTARTIMSDVSSNVQFSSTSPVECVNPSYFPSLNISNDCSSANYSSNGVTSTNYQYTVSASNGQQLTMDENAYCVGTVRYTYLTIVSPGSYKFSSPELGTDQALGITTYYVLWRDNLGSSSDSCIPEPMNTSSAPSSGGYEMMLDHTRITNFSLTLDSSSSDLYDINISTAYGNSSLLNINGGNTTCNSGTGTAFCGTSSLTTTVAGRVY